MWGPTYRPFSLPELKGDSQTSRGTGKEFFWGKESVSSYNIFSPLIHSTSLESESCSVMSRLFATPWAIQSEEFLRSEYWSGGGLSLLQGIFPTQGSNPGLPHCRRILHLSRQGNPHLYFSSVFSFSMKEVMCFFFF